MQPAGTANRIREFGPRTNDISKFAVPYNSVRPKDIAASEMMEVTMPLACRTEYGTALTLNPTLTERHARQAAVGDPLAAPW